MCARRIDSPDDAPEPKAQRTSLTALMQCGVQQGLDEDSRVDHKPTDRTTGEADPSAADPWRGLVRANHRCPEAPLALALVGEIRSSYRHDLVSARAMPLVEAQRLQAQAGFGIERLLEEYRLSSEEGLRLLCLAEALLRIDDHHTADALIRDKIGGGDWAAHAGHSDAAWVNASTAAMRVARRLVETEREDGVVAALLARGGEPTLRAAVKLSIRLLSDQFVFATTIERALIRAKRQRGWRHSFDMLGEAARTEIDAQRYLEAYRRAIRACGSTSSVIPDGERPSVSIKLSAVHPRFEEAQRRRVMSELADRLVELCAEAKDAGIGIVLDAEESERLELSLDLIEHVIRSTELGGWGGFGVALQAYQKRARALADWLVHLSWRLEAPLAVRLVKGAYWDGEIRRTQLAGLADYPVFTRKSATDVSYLACARALLAAPGIFPAFATHNALSVAAILEAATELGRQPHQLEFQRLHGMGEGLYEGLIAADGYACRVYAPVGAHRDLLAYLVRRLLENGANSSFVHHLASPAFDRDALFADPLQDILRHEGRSHPMISRPADLFEPVRRNSAGIDLHDRAALDALERRMADRRDDSAATLKARAGPRLTGAVVQIRNPADRRKIVGEVRQASVHDVPRTMELACRAQTAWAALPVDDRAAVLERFADRIEANRDAYIALLVREAGRTLADSAAEVREAVDFCRFYAVEARRLFEPRELAGPTGERNSLYLAGRGVFASISPWNFPLAILVGQIAAALVAGNAVVAKPASQTPLIACRAVIDWLETGLPAEVLQLLPGGADVGRSLVEQPGIAGVAFTGSFGAARAIACSLAARQGPIVPLIAETGGINAMIVDGSALPEQVVADAILSGFNSAGQRCSALRLLCLQRDIAERVLDMLRGAMDELVMGDPADRATDIGPLIDEAARIRLEAHLASGVGRLIHRAPLGSGCINGTFFAPLLIELDDPGQLRDEVFGPVIHVVRWEAGALDALIDSINASGFGLTLGVHSRIGATVERVKSRARVGNLYVNRPMVGAVVGVQPFGGEGFSGTGPKAGGPYTLLRYATERCISVDTTSAGGNASLMSMRGR